MTFPLMRAVVARHAARRIHISRAGQLSAKCGGGMLDAPAPTTVPQMLSFHRTASTDNYKPPPRGTGEGERAIGMAGLGWQETTAEVKDPSIIFDNVVNALENEVGRLNLAFPKEIIWLGGAPGAGKGTHSASINRLRGITVDPIVVSDLLSGPEAQEMKARGELISDRTVIELVLRELLKPQYEQGVIVDGFPRSPVQSDIITLLHDLMLDLRNEFFHTPEGHKFRRPIFHLTVLFCEERVAVERQLKRGQEVLAHNSKVKESGEGELLEERPTDMSEELATKRYVYFKERTFESLKALKKTFHYHFIDAGGSISAVRARIHDELHYQSSLELGPDTFDSISTVPLAEDLIKHSRQNLVRRLDKYQARHPDLFQKVIQTLVQDFFRIINRQALSGNATIRTESPIFYEPMAVEMALDVLQERGYIVALDIEKQKIPYRFDHESGVIESLEKKTLHFYVKWPRPAIRATALALGK